MSCVMTVFTHITEKNSKQEPDNYIRKSNHTMTHFSDDLEAYFHFIRLNQYVLTLIFSSDDFYTIEMTTNRLSWDNMYFPDESNNFQSQYRSSNRSKRVTTYHRLLLVSFVIV